MMKNRRNPPHPLRPPIPLIGAALALAAVAALAGTREQDVDPPSGRSDAGRFTGTVTVGPQLRSRRIRFQLYPDLALAASARRASPEQEEAGNVVVYLEELSPGRSFPPAPPARPAIRQEGMAFVPHLLAVVKGSTVEFPNADPVFHNVFSLARAATFDLGRYPKGTSRSVRFDKPGIVKVFCHIHSDMSAVILVLDNPLFAVPDAQGRYRIDNVPPGEYRIVAWHERARPLSRKVSSAAGSTSVVDFSIPLSEPADGG